MDGDNTEASTNFITSPIQNQKFNQKPPHNLRNLIVLSGIVLVILSFGIGSYYFEATENKLVTQKHQQPSPSLVLEKPKIGLAKREERFSVEVSKDPKDKLKSDIYLKDKNTGGQSLFMTLDGVLSGHYHPAEYHNGNVYILRRAGGDLGYINNPNWKDELWIYNSQKQGKLLYSVQGLDFRVSDDEQLIAVKTNNKLELLDANGKSRAKISTDDLAAVAGLPKGDAGFLGWGRDTIWFDNAAGPELRGLVSVDVNTYRINKYDLSYLSAGVEYDFSPDTMLLAYTNFPPIFDEEGHNRYIKNKEQVNLVVYDLRTKNKEVVSSAITKRFMPRWVTDDTLEFNDPNGTGRITKKIH